MGPVSLVGMAVLVALVPVVQGITNTLGRLRTGRAKCTDARIECTNALLQGIQVCKLNHYEPHYQERLLAIRNEEWQWLVKETAVWATTLSVSKLSAAFAAAATFTTYVLVDDSHVLTAPKSFATFLLLAALRFPINYAGRFLGRYAQAKSSLTRIAAFLSSQSTWSNDATTRNQLAATGGPPLVVKQASFVVGNNSTHGSAAAFSSHGGDSMHSSIHSEPKTTSFVVSTFDFTVHKGEVLACCGPVGSGKSTLLQGLLGHLPAASETNMVDKRGSIAWVPQSPFILNTTVRDNILFGRPFLPQVYYAVVEACCLGPDLKSLGSTGDLTEIGERGKLPPCSSGQKQRISLARAAYGQPDLILLDDPLSALDAGTAKKVFSNLIRGPAAFLKDSAVILVTHASHFLNRVDQIAVIVEGRNKFLGSWNQLVEFQAPDEATQRAIDHIRLSIQEAHSDDEQPEHRKDPSAPKDATKKLALMTVEEREHGLSSSKTWLLWFKYAGGVSFFAIMVVLLTVDRLFYFGQEFWVARWTDAAEGPISFLGIQFDAQTEGRPAQFKFLAAYAIILLTALLANLARSEWTVAGGSRAAKNVFNAMLIRVLGAPLSFFETTPMGRLLNRFTYDMEICDFVLSQNMSLLLVATSSYVSGMLVMVGILPILSFSVFPVTIIYIGLLWYYRRTGTDLQRLDALARSPIQSMMTEGMDGVSTIRILQKESFFLEKYQRAVDRSTSSLLNFVSAQRWLGCRIEMMAAITVFIPALFICSWNDYLQLRSGIVGLLIVGSLNFTLALSYLVDYFAEAESAITAIERVDAMAKVPQEKPFVTDQSIALKESWPSSGHLKFDKVSMRYRPGLPLALNGLSFEIPSGKSCGIVGRTGAGKSSLTVAIFRLVELESGRIFLDGVDLGTLGLADVRGRPNGMAIIPQDPFLAGSTIRECLDPFSQSTDSEITSALEAVRLRQSEGDIATSFELESPIQEGGSNLSVGERQLLNLARALLTKPKVLVLDEATASIDGATDALIQEMLRTRFPGTTLLTVAHRLNTIMDNDFVLVMHHGRAAEFGAPCDLLLAKDGLFSELVDATGAPSAIALRAMAQRK
eukprot:scaffold4442_cov125-Amphora_coffeaeformis.AAC.27